jgi:hypothetical protein
MLQGNDGRKVASIDVILCRDLSWGVWEVFLHELSSINRQNKVGVTQIPKPSRDSFAHKYRLQGNDGRKVASIDVILCRDLPWGVWEVFLYELSSINGQNQVGVIQIPKTSSDSFAHKYMLQGNDGRKVASIGVTLCRDLSWSVGEVFLHELSSINRQNKVGVTLFPKKRQL